MTTRTRTTTATESSQLNRVHPDFASVESSDGVTFSGGVMMVNGREQRPVEVQHWESSNGITTYATVMWEAENGEKRCSCNCLGWANKKKNKPRRCKHTDDMMGIKTCRANKAENVRITTIAQAEAHIPKLDGRILRSLMLE